MLQKTKEQALIRLMELCARAEKSSGDARRLMAHWGVPESDRAAVLEKLIREKFIDDARYAAAYVAEKTRLNGWGPHKIKAGLRQKGITLAQVLEPESTRARLDERLRRKLKTIQAHNPQDLKNKLLRHGLSLGYDFDDVRDGVDRLLKSTDD